MIDAREALRRLGVSRVPVPVPFVEAGGPANVYVIEEQGGGIALFDAGIGTREGRAALLAGFAELGLSLGDVRRIFISHGHIDHYGYARAAQEESGAPVFAHVSLILGQDRTKLSKRHGATSVSAYAEAGFLPDEIRGWQAYRAWKRG